MDAASSVYLLDLEPGLARFVPESERDEARRVSLPVRLISKGAHNIEAVLDEGDAFGAVLLDGMILERARVGEQMAAWLLGRGDVLSLSGEPRSMLLSDCARETLVQSRIALLSGEVLAAVGHWPGLAAGLHMRAAVQRDRLTAQLVICQLPRVEERLMAIMWLLAEAWGHVTPAGTLLPITFTHDVLGAMIGARRSTVTLALGELAERGALIRQDRGWLLLEPPPQPIDQAQELELPRLLEEGRSEWHAAWWPEPDDRARAAVLHEAVRRLREQHRRNQALVREQLTISGEAARRRAKMRQHRDEQRLARRSVPS